MNSEIRRAAEGIQRRTLELRADGNNFEICARAIKYNAISQDLGGFVERIAPGCFSDSLSAGDEIVCLVNHNSSEILGRTRNGTLSISDSPTALTFRCKLNKNVQAHRDLYELVKDGTISECSFAFLCDKQTWDDSGTVPLRTVQHGRLMDVSVVVSPAYSDGATLAEARSKKEQQNSTRAESIAKFRKLTRSLAEAARKAFIEVVQRDGAVGGADCGDEMALVREHLAMAHEMQECAYAMSGTASDIMDDWDWDADEDNRSGSKRQSPYAPYGDPDDLRAFRKAHQEVHAMIEQCCNRLADCRLKQPQKGK